MRTFFVPIEQELQSRDFSFECAAPSVRTGLEQCPVSGSRFNGWKIVEVNADGLARYILRHVEVLTGGAIVPERTNVADQVHLAILPVFVRPDPKWPALHKNQVNSGAFNRRLIKRKTR